MADRWRFVVGQKRIIWMCGTKGEIFCYEMEGRRGEAHPMRAIYARVEETGEPKVHAQSNIPV